MLYIRTMPQKRQPQKIGDLSQFRNGRYDKDLVKEASPKKTKGFVYIKPKQQQFTAEQILTLTHHPQRDIPFERIIYRPIGKDELTTSNQRRQVLPKNSSGSFDNSRESRILRQANNRTIQEAREENNRFTMNYIFKHLLKM